MLFLTAGQGLYMRLGKQRPVLRQVISHETYLPAAGLLATGPWGFIPILRPPSLASQLLQGGRDGR
ncbi:hypothetical protein BZ163_32200 [Pseudomonas sp. VI4.1]|nr:hypothetical protein BZ163_32200 [Pseudomonas sp. VI4.1]